MTSTLILLSFVALICLSHRISTQLLMMVALFIPNVFLLALSVLAICGQIIDHTISYALAVFSKFTSALKSVPQPKKTPILKGETPSVGSQEDTLPTSNGTHHAHSFGYSVRFLLRICHYILSAAVSPLYAGEDSYRIQIPQEGAPTKLVIFSVVMAGH